MQIVDAPFFLKQGEIRYAHTLELPASRGRIVDRNGLILAASVPAPSIWAIPKDLEGDARSARQLARAARHDARRARDRSRQPELRLAAPPGRRRRSRRQVHALRIKGMHEVREYKRKYPEGEAAAHVVGFTNVEDRGQEGIELAFQKDLAGTRRHAPRHQGPARPRGRGHRRQRAPVDGRDIELSVDSKVQFFAYQRIRDAVAAHKAKAGSVVVLDAQSGEVLALANYPSYMPSERTNLTGAQLRNRALTDTFEPGSTMKPFIAAWALETGRVTPDTMIQTAPGRMQITGSTITDAHPHGNLTVPR